MRLDKKTIKKLGLEKKNGQERADDRSKNPMSFMTREPTAFQAVVNWSSTFATAPLLSSTRGKAHFHRPSTAPAASGLIPICQSVLIASTLLMLGCTQDDVESEPEAKAFEFVTGEDQEKFRARTDDVELIETLRSELIRPIDERFLFMHGRIERGNNDNLNWSWHFVDSDWTLSEKSMELCDGKPSDVESDLPYWIDEVGSFCPWSSRVVAEIGN